MAAETDSATAPEVSIFDLEDPICRARNSAKVVDLLVETLLSSKHPDARSTPGLLALLIDAEEAQAMRHMTGELLNALRQLNCTWEAAFEHHTRRPSKTLCE